MSDKTIRRILEVLDKKQLTSLEISKKIKVDKTIVSSTLSQMASLNMIFVIDQIRRDNRTFNLYARRQLLPIERRLPSAQFSEDEMHYGREGRKYKLEDVIKEL